MQALLENGKNENIVKVRYNEAHSVSSHIYIIQASDIEMYNFLM